MDHDPDKFVDIGEIVYCRCGNPLGRRKDRNTISISKPVQRQAAVHIKAEYQGGPFKISCPICGFGAIFQSFEEEASMEDSVASSQEKEEGVK